MRFHDVPLLTNQIRVQLALDAAQTARPEKALTALEKLAIYRQHRPRVFDCPASADAAEHSEIRMLNAVMREFYGGEGAK